MLQSEFEYIMISLVTGLTGYFLGAIGGMIIVSYLTTVEPRNEVKTKTEIE
jgi:ABC-type lipoprotein release transport system permease subunit